MTRHWMAIALAIAGAAAFALQVLLRYVEFAEFSTADTPWLLGGLGPALVSLGAAAFAWWTPRSRMAAGGALLALASIAGWSFLWGLTLPVIDTAVPTAVGALLVGLAGLLLLT